ncbi:hypothetical protein [Limnoglobus roseus]|uniref:SMI1/KNR4 family protein n=1 Tax=Limnoglobus roseus TaxID=2598579 RepID=A0A5C1AIJ6_9BACT|nr:hypothetical protein [Limnoglobus roseus]QEL19249.1 hypothetical protein PX52LOC_06311 [Limnoglobus roseus]
MTEAEWLTAEKPTPMVEFVRGRVGHWKLRLFAVACCRRIQHLFADGRSREAVEVAERYAIGSVSDRDRFEAHVAADLAETEIADAYLPNHGEDSDDWLAEVGLDAGAAANTATLASSDQPEGMDPDTWRTLFAGRPFIPGQYSTHEEAQRALAHAVRPLRYEEIEWRDGADRANAKCDEAVSQAELLRCVVGNPFRPVTFSPDWLTPTAVGLAEGIYEDRAFDRLPILADALQDAGCEDAAILAHCRGDGLHVRGCWVVDGVLGKG